MHALARALAAAAVLAVTTWAAGQTPSTGPAAKTPEAPNDSPPPTVPQTSSKPSAPAASAPAEETTVRVSRPGTFEIHFRDSGLREAFELLGSQGHKNIVATKEVNGKVNADLYDVTFKEALEAILSSTGYAYVEEGNFINVMTPEQLQKKIESLRKLSTRAFRLAYIGAVDAKTLVTPALSKDGSIAVTPAAAMGIAASSTDAGGNSYATSDLLVVRDYDENIDRIEKMINEMDVKPQQVLIEATVLQASLNETNELGIDFNSLAGVNFSSLGATATGDTNLLIPSTTVNHMNTPSGAFRTDFASSVNSGGTSGASFGYIGSQLGIFVRALETIADTTVLANPKLLVVNKQRGEVIVGSEDGYLTTTVTETVSTQTVQMLETGTRLIVRPFIGKDGYVRMEIHPEQSSGSVSLVGTSALPQKDTTEVTSNVMVRDGHTIVIGGLFRETTTNSRSQLPGIGNIPILGAAARYASSGTKRDEIIILITPHIIQQAPDEGVSEQIKDDVERFRIGARKGLMWFGRSRLANMYVEHAKDAIAEGKTDLAICNLDMALATQPRQIEAMRLKERLTRKAYWADENRDSSIDFVIQHMVMHELGKPTSDIIPPRKPLDASRVDPAVRESLGIEEDYQEPLPIDKLISGRPARNTWPTTQPVKATPTKMTAESNK
jgi:type IV pilus assembly protein PilQ